MGHKRPIVSWQPPADMTGPGARLLLVIGCPRSGTRSFARMLSLAGIRVGHERVGLHGTVSSYFAVDDTFYHGPHQSTKDKLRDFTFQHKWMLVRHPLKIVASLHFGSPPQNWWDWQMRHTGIDIRQGSLLASASFVLRWTELCEQGSPERVFRIEDWKQDWNEIANRLSIAVEPLPDFSHSNANNPKPSLSWNDVEQPFLRDGLKKLAEKHGYDV